MISGATRGAGGRALGAHLADAKQLNERTELGLSRGLVGATIREQIAELTDLSSHSRAAQPLYHLHADPPPGAAWNETAWQRYWSLTEKEFDLERAAFSEERHVKDGREHRHRVYNLVRADGTTNSMAHDFPRREKLSRIMEFETGAPLTPGAHNRSVIAALDREGRPDVAAAMREAGLDTMERPRAAITPQQRAQAERTRVDPKILGATVLTAWRVSDDAAAFRTALAEQGLQLAQGDRAAVVVDATGDVHPLARMLGRESKAAGGNRIAAGDVTARLAELDLPSVDQARSDPATQTITPATHSAQQTITPAKHSAQQPVAGHGNSIKKGQQDADAGRTAAAVGASFRAALSDALRQPATAQAVVDRGPPGDRGGGDGRPLAVTGDRQEGAGTRPVRGPSGGNGNGQPVAPAEPAGAEGIRDEPARPGDQAPRDDRREPDQDRATRGRDRIAARRASIGLAAAIETCGGRLAELTRLLTHPPSIASIQTDRTEAAMAVSRVRVDAVLGTAPWPNAADRKAGPLQDVERDRIKAAMDARGAAALAAQDTAARLRGRIGLIARALALIGLQTASVQAAAEATRTAEQAKRAAKDLRLDYRDDLAQADRSGTAEASRRQRDQDRWEDRPDVRAARREEAGNELVAAALRAGDPEIKEVLRREDGRKARRDPKPARTFRI